MFRVFIGLIIIFSGVTRAQIDPLGALQERQNDAIARAKYSVVHIKAYDKRTPGLENIGSGVIVHQQGFIVTNDHVVNGFDTIEVTINRGRKHVIYTASILKSDPKADLSLIKVNGSVLLYPIQLPKNKLLDIGATVFVIGSPFGLDHTVTKGIVSKRRRSVVIGGIVYSEMIQTDANINQGNSGGAVINMNGEIIGIASAIYSETTNSSGIGFAIPIARVKDFYQAEVQQHKKKFLKKLRTKDLTLPFKRILDNQIYLPMVDRSSKQFQMEKQRRSYHLSSALLVKYTTILVLITFAIMVAIILFLRRKTVVLA